MAMRSVFGKLKALTPRMLRSGAAPPKDMLGHQRPYLVDPTKYKSPKELNEALLALLDKESKAEREAFKRCGKAYDRVTYVTSGAVFGGTIWFTLWFIGPLLEDV